ncbi:MAG TPA: hypothetical protein VLS48_00945 [Anaerolineales bacterium]|nr:hypothetical protein [Anaerolineales bacterium]
MISADYEFRFLNASLEILEDYLKSNDLYWSTGAQPPAGGASYPQLTLGALLLALLNASAHVQTPAEENELARISDQLGEIRNEWRAAWEKKASHEFRARLNLWSNFIEDYREDKSANFDRFAYEVGRRVQLHLIAPYASGVSPAEFALLEQLDRLLKAVWQPGEFVWSAELADVFPPDPYWYLYGRLPAE